MKQLEKPIVEQIYEQMFSNLNKHKEFNGAVLKALAAELKSSMGKKAERVSGILRDEKN